ncbi:arrestin C-terminal domain-containing protein [Phanerochaete sordida]|uniref:Arrestin C-terminal domain-containing protein n=1 Tax=Phanerochaete sordida TaxID=48140 RepID=A0A9P3GQG9_9APHY|nr:arrestin C-terminal domain-containing protein [Phanerochaete sordida]
MQGGAATVLGLPVPVPRRSLSAAPRASLSLGGCPEAPDAGSALPRDVTLLSFGGPHARSAAELKALLGDSHARLRAGAAIVPEYARHAPDRKARREHAVAYEQAKARARVEVDIVLESNVCVQGGHLRGHIKVRIRKRGRKEGVILLSEGKIRVVGYEVVASEDAHHTFFHCGAPLSAVTDASANLYTSAPDGEGFAPGVEGLHVMPFAFKLPTDSSFGSPKGMLTLTGGALVRYIAMVSMKVRDSDTGKRSIAHFYRQCEVWPYLDPATILRSAPRPLQASAAKSLALLGNSSKVKLTAQMHRLHWAAGSRCPVNLHVGNDSKKTVKSLVLTLVRTITVFRPRPGLNAGGDRDADACQTATTHKAVAESVLEMCEGVARGHASAKGWWTGVPPGREFDFIHYIQLPADALSITRSRLLEVEYSIRVTISAGSLSPDVSVTLPVRIFNLISIDPPPSAGLLSAAGAYIKSSQSLCSHATEGPPLSSTSIAALASSNKLLSVTPVEEEPEDDLPLPPYPTSRAGSLRVTNPDRPSSGLRPPPISSEESDSSLYSTSLSTSDMDGMNAAPRPPKKLGNLQLKDGAGSDDEVEAVLHSAKVNRSPRPPTRATSLRTTKRLAQRVSAATDSEPEGAQAVLSPGRTPRMEGVGSGAPTFASRVQDKKRAIALARIQERNRAGPAAGLPRRAAVSAIFPASSASTDEGEHTPRVGYASVRAARRPTLDSSDDSFGYSSTEPTSDADECAVRRQISQRSQRGSRQLPRPPSLSPRYEQGGQSVSSSGSGSRILPTPPSVPGLPPPSGIPPVPPIPPHLLALCGRSPVRESDPLRAAIIRPPRSPMRPILRGGSGSTSTDSGSGVKGRIAALEHRCNSLEEDGVQ